MKNHMIITNSFHKHKEIHRYTTEVRSRNENTSNDLVEAKIKLTKKNDQT